MSKQDEIEVLNLRIEVLEATNKALAMIVNDHEGAPTTMREVLTAAQASYARYEQLLDAADKHGQQARHIADDVMGGWISYTKALDVCVAHGIALDEEAL